MPRTNRPGPQVGIYCDSIRDGTPFGALHVGTIVYGSGTARLRLWHKGARGGYGLVRVADANPHLRSAPAKTETTRETPAAPAWRRGA